MDPFPIPDLMQTVHATVRREELLTGVDHLLVAVSGGADSVALLRLLRADAGPLEPRLTVGHVHHGIRGAEADADAAFVKRLARELRLPFCSRQVDVPALARAGGLSLEMAAREARYSAFRDMAGELAIDAVATGHTLDDQAETLLLRLLRGTGPHGLRGIHARTTLHDLTVIRPLLEVRRADLRDWLRCEGHPWREDASNQDTDMQRNRLRAEVMPALRGAFGEGSIAALARTARLFAAEADWLGPLETEALAACSAPAPPPGDRSDLTDPSDPAGLPRTVARIPALDAGALQQLPAALQRRVLTRWLHDAGLTAACASLERIRELLGSTAGTRSAPLEGGGTVVRVYDRLYARAPDAPGPATPFEVVLALPGATAIEGAGLLVSAEFDQGYTRQCPPGAGVLPAEAWFSAERIGDAPLILRSRRPGDRIRPLGLGGTQRLQDILVDAKLPVARRDAVPLLTCRNDIIWVAGYQIADGWAVPGAEAPSVHVSVRACDTGQALRAIVAS